MHLIQIAGVTPFTTIDYPGSLSAVLFCQGCPWRCGYCHNPQLQPLQKGLLNWRGILSFLKERRGFLDAVVFSGGEPTMQKHLPEAVQDVKRMGYKVGLHTAGIIPGGLKQILPLIDWVGMDIKAPFEKYETITKVPRSGQAARQCAQAIIDAGVDYEFRTTFDSKILSSEDLDQLSQQLVQMGAKCYALQRCRPGVGEAWDPSLIEQLRKRFERFLIR